jgi:hypothetical protein
MIFKKFCSLPTLYIYVFCEISSFCCVVDEMCAFLGNYEEWRDEPVPTFRDIIGPIFKGQEFKEAKDCDFLTLLEGTDKLSRNVGTKLPLYAALYPRNAQPHLRVLCGSQNKQRVFPYTALTDWSL